MRIAYADPPYPGQAKRHYRDHPDYAGEVDVPDLIDELASFDGWALSTSAAALQEVLTECPSGARVAVWSIKNTEAPGNRGTWHWSWEPVILRSPRPPIVRTRDILHSFSPKGFVHDPFDGQATLTGQKPTDFCWWLFGLLGMTPDDELVDLFPGSGAVGRAWDRWRSQTRIAV